VVNTHTITDRVIFNLGKSAEAAFCRMKTEAESRSEIVVPDQRSSGLFSGSLRIPTMKIKWRALGTLVALAVLGVVGWWLTRPAPVQCVQPWRGELRQEVFGTGTLEAKVVIGFSAKIDRQGH
jgi:hypothetical protein